jgi:transcriptional regulator with XRE-family HTH domain
MGKKTNFRQRIALGNRLRRLREEKSMTLEQLATKADIGIGSVSEIERGLRSPNVSTLTALASALGLECYELLSGK